jgi:hypothetical protein
LNSLPGLQAAMVTDIPLGGVDHGFVIDGHPPVVVGGEPDVQTLSVMGDYFRVMQIPLRARDGTSSTDDRHRRGGRRETFRDWINRWIPLCIHLFRSLTRSGEAG